MKRRAGFHRLAERELNEAAVYYDRESPGLGAEFLDEAERCVGAVIENPHAGSIVLDEARWRLLRRFPYGLVYRITPDGIRVLAVMNLRRRPGYWIGRK